MSCAARALTATEHQLEAVRPRSGGRAGWELELKGSQGGGGRSEEADRDTKQQRIILIIAPSHHRAIIPVYLQKQSDNWSHGSSGNRPVPL